jgi:hypothetical protein
MSYYTIRSDVQCRPYKALLHMRVYFYWMIGSLQCVTVSIAALPRGFTCFDPGRARSRHREAKLRQAWSTRVVPVSTWVFRYSVELPLSSE